MTESRNKYYELIPEIVEEYMNEINKLAGTNYMPFNYYGSKSAKRVIVAMGSVCETIKETIDELNDEKGLSAKFEKFKLKNEQKALERKRNSLKSKEETLDHLRRLEKQGTVNFGMQIYKIIVKKYAYGR